MDYSRLRKKLWIGTLLLDAAILAVVAIFWPEMIRYITGGIILGLFYLASLTFSASGPLPKVQFAFSLIRMALFAYLIVWIADHDTRAMALVMCGFLSYKGILTLEYVTQALPALRHLKPGHDSRKAESNPRAA